MIKNKYTKKTSNTDSHTDKEVAVLPPKPKPKPKHKPSQTKTSNHSKYNGLCQVCMNIKLCGQPKNIDLLRCPARVITQQ